MDLGKKLHLSELCNDPFVGYELFLTTAGRVRTGTGIEVVEICGLISSYAEPRSRKEFLERLPDIILAGHRPARRGPVGIMPCKWCLEWTHPGIQHICDKKKREYIRGKHTKGKNKKNLDTRCKSR